MIAQILGYLASVLLAISLMVNNDLKFRWLNTFGCLAFIVYGIMINALPVILTNSLLLLINSIYLIKIYRATETFDLLTFEPGVTLVQRFLSFYKSDIKTYFPQFDEIDKSHNLCFVVLRDLVIANIFTATLDDNGDAYVHLNYTVEKYRDYKVGKFIFNQERDFLASKGINRLVYTEQTGKQHQKFLQVMGFKNELINNRHCLVKNI